MTVKSLLPSKSKPINLKVGFSMSLTMKPIFITLIENTGMKLDNFPRKFVEA